MRFMLCMCGFVISLVVYPYLSSAQLYSPSTIVGVRGIFGFASPGDFDNDGDEDLLVTGSEWNQRTLKFFVVENGEVIERTGGGLPGEASRAEWIDYDGDEDLDVFLYVTGDKGTDGYFYINEDGTFTPVPLPLPNLRRSTFSIVDYDQDGDIDILMAGFEGTAYFEKTYILKNTASGFVKINTNLQGYIDGKYAWTDFDGDNDLDVLISGSYSSSTLYSNNGGDAFEIFKSDFPAAVRGQIQWADFDQDNDPDILMAGFGNAGARSKIFKNNGDKTFSEYAGVTLVGTEQGDSQWIDYDMDGDLDIFHSGWASGTFVVQLFALDNGTYTEVTPVGLGGDDFIVSSFAFFDYDEDEDFDILMLNDGYKCRIYRNNLKSNPYPLDTRPSWPVDLVAHPQNQSEVKLDWKDFGTDETSFSLEMRILPAGIFQEIKMVGPTGGSQTAGTIVDNLDPGAKYEFRVRALNGSGYSRYSETVISGPASGNLVLLDSFTGIYLTYSSSWSDIDNDGDLDLTYSGHADAAENYEPKTVILKNTDGLLSDQPHSLPALTGYDLDWADYDQDGDLDLLLSGTPASGTAQTKLLVNQGNFTFTEYSETPIRGVRSGFARWVDVNSDGYKDIFLSGTVDGDNTIHVSQLLINKRDNTFEELFSTGLPILYQSDLELNDFDLDGDVDFLMGGFKDTLNFSLTRTSELYLNQGDNTFKLNQVFHEFSDAAIESDDFDLDGDADIIVSGNYEATRIYWNDNGKFTIDAKNELFGFVEGDLKVGDIDNDGDTDIIMGGNGESLKVTTYINDGTGVFREGYYALTRLGHNLYSLGDLDQDGDLDLFETGTFGGPSTSIFENRTLTLNAKPDAPSILKAEGIAGGIKLVWARGNDDHTPSQSLTSNLYLKDPAGRYLYNSHADVTTGQLKTPARGNAFLNDSIILKGLVPGTYTVGVQNIDNSFVASSFTTSDVTVNFIAPMLVSDSAACESSTAQIEVLGNSIVWYSDANLTDSIGYGNIFRPWVKESDTVFYAVQRLGDTRSPSLKVSVKVYSKITDGIVQSGDSLISPNGGSYQWFENGIPLSGLEQRKLFVNHPGVFSVEVTNGPCSHTVSFTVRPASPAPITFSPDLCIDEAQVLTASGSNIQWYDKTGAVIGSEESLTLPAATLGDTVVFVTQTINSIESEKAVIIWNVYPFPEKAVDLVNGKLVASQGLSYQWYKNNAEIPGAVSREFGVIDDGIYHATVANQSCVTVSDKFLYTGIEEPVNSIRIFHQRPDGSVVIDAGSHTVSRITVFDYMGKELVEMKDPEKAGGVYLLDTSTLPPGFFIAVIEGSAPFNGRFIKVW